MVTKETAAYRPILILTDSANEEGENMMGEEIKANYDWIKTEIRDIVQRGWQWIVDDVEFSKLLNTKN